jgi:cytochrome c-type biogenesis protein CcmH/NrfG
VHAGVVDTRGKRLLTALAAVTAVAGVALYALRGDSQASDGSRAERPESVRGAEISAVAPPDAPNPAELERHLASHPADARALVLKARLDMQAQRFEAAAGAYQGALEASSKVARDPAVWLEYAEARGMLQSGSLAGRPRQLIDKALSIDAANPKALDLAGSAAWEGGEFATAARYWKRLLEQLAPGSTRHIALSTAIERAEQRARFELSPVR